MEMTPGSRIRRYEIGVPLGAGGMGEVFLARDLELDRTVALKILPDSAASSPEHVRRFVQEAKAAVGLNHPNIAHIYDAGDEQGVRFMVMEYVQGQTLRQRMHEQRLKVSEALDIAAQVASALASAHAGGIVHRDIKPENVMLRPDGYVKVLDFGLAKLTANRPNENTAVLKTEPGLVMGTMHYMSPEQLRGEEVDGRSDVFSLGVLLYEMLTGHRPFESSTAAGVVAAILSEEPALPNDVQENVRAIVRRALAKKREERPSAREIFEALKEAQHETGRIRSGDMPTQALTQVVEVPRPRKRLLLFGLLALLGVAAIAYGLWAMQRARVRAEAEAALAGTEKLVAERKFFEAWDDVMRAQPILGADDARIAVALEKIGVDLNVKSEPAGATVHLQRYTPEGDAPRELVGTTPIEKKKVPRGDYLMTVEKSGYATLTRPLSLSLTLAGNRWLDLPMEPLTVRLGEASRVPAGMVFVPGGPYKLAGVVRPTTKTIPLEDYAIDRTEVSQREFETFIRDGGYRRRELWKHPFVKDGKTLSFDEATALFRDKTGLAGPRNWSGGKPAAGREDHPVTDITWYEAAAFAEWKGKRLPTIFEWDKAARDGVVSPFGMSYPWGITYSGTDVTQRANFRGAGTMPVDSLPFGMSRVGALHMAGNVSEWCRNTWDDGQLVLGGSSEDATYGFLNVSGFPPFYSSERLGFRCVKSTGDQGAMPLTSEVELTTYQPVGDAEFARLARVYDYDRNVPLNAKVLETIDATDWTREKISFTGGNGKTALLYLYLPKGYKRPLQIIQFGPPTDIVRGLRSISMGIEQALGTSIRSGRAAFGVVLEGYIERPWPAGFVRPDHRSPEFAEATAEQMTDIRRALDYLATRKDIDITKLGYMGPSAGSYTGVLITAIDDRYRSVMFTGAGIRRTEREVTPAASRVHFAPRIKAPKLLLHGRWDETHPLRSDTEPLFALMREPKKLVIYDGGHIPPWDYWLKATNEWFDQTLGPVQ